MPPLGERLEPLSRLVTLRPGQIVIGQQDRTNDVFIVQEGRALQIDDVGELITIVRAVSGDVGVIPRAAESAAD